MACQSFVEPATIPAYFGPYGARTFLVDPHPSAPAVKFCPVCYSPEMDARELLVSPIAHMPPARILDGLSSAQSDVHLPGAAHSVVEIVAHMVHWQSWFLQRCAGVAIPPVAQASLGWPAANAGEWEPLCGRFLEGVERAVEIGLDEATSIRRIDPPIEFPPLADFTVANAITHIAIHNSHHLGQIIVLRQILGAWPPPEGSYTW
jgi:uncharacterized damage-inducible protein DinB